MRKLIFITLLALALLASGSVSAQTVSTKVTAGGGKLEAADLVELKVTIVSVNLGKREVVVKYKDGVTETLQAGDAVKRLDEIRPGDTATIQMLRSLALSLNKTEGAKPAVIATEAEGRTKKTELPGGAIARQLNITARITAVDAKASTITLTGPQGNSAVLEVDPEVLKKVKTDDLVNAVYTEAVAVKITRDAAPPATPKK